MLLVDRASFPSDIPHGHFIHRHGPRRLRDWGLLDKVAERAPAITSMLFDAGDFPLVARNLVEDGVAWGYGPRRTTFDTILIDAAAESGADVRQAFSVFEYIIENGTVVGIHGRTQSGATVLERAPLVVGADGRNSGLARAVSAPMYNQVPADPLLLLFLLERRRGRAIRAVRPHRTAPRHLLVQDRERSLRDLRRCPMEEFETFRRDIERSVHDTLDLVPDFAGRVRAGRREERFYGCSDLPNFYRKPYGSGWALIGDAGLHKDPVPRTRHLRRLARRGVPGGAIREGLGGSRTLTDALADFEKETERRVSRGLSGEHRGRQIHAVPARVPRRSGGREGQTRGRDEAHQGENADDQSGRVLQSEEPAAPLAIAR